MPQHIRFPSPALRRRLKRWVRTARRFIARNRRPVAAAGIAVLAVGLSLALLPSLVLWPPRHVRIAAPVHHAPPPAVARLAHPVVPQGQPREAIVQPPPPVPAPAAAPSAAPPTPALPTPALPAAPAWRRFAVAPPPIEHRPMIAVVLDDLGIDKSRTAVAIRLSGGVTLSFMAYATDLAAQTAAARRAGHELVLHVPMQPLGHVDPGPHALLTSLDRDQIVARLRWDLDRFGGYVAINNHMGSKFTADAAGMTPVIEELRARGVAFLDSRTTPKSVGARLAAAYGVPYATRDVFLDDVIERSAIDRQLAETEAVARRRGSAIAIGHAHDPTLAALSAWAPHLAAQGFVLVPLSTIVSARTSEATQAARQQAGAQAAR